MGRVQNLRLRQWRRTHLLHALRDKLVGAANIAANSGGGPTSTRVPVLVEHRRAGRVPARRDRRRHLYDQRRRSCLASGHPDEPAFSSGCRSSRAETNRARGEDQAASPVRVHIA
jgi:hypothetical protein